MNRQKLIQKRPKLNRKYRWKLVSATNLANEPEKKKFSENCKRESIFARF